MALKTWSVLLCRVLPVLLCLSFFVMFSVAVSGVAFADSSGPFFGNIGDFPVLVGSLPNGNDLTLDSTNSGYSGVYGRIVGSPWQNLYLDYSQTYSRNNQLVILLPSPLLYQASLSVSSGWFVPSDGISNFSGYSMLCYNANGVLISVDSSPLIGSHSLPAGTRFIQFPFILTKDSTISASQFSYSAFYYDDVTVSGGGSGGGSYDPSLDQQILAGMTAAAQYLVSLDGVISGMDSDFSSLQTGPYTMVTGLDNYSNGNITYRTQTYDLQNFLTALGVASGLGSSLASNMNSNWGTYFTYYMVDGADPQNQTQVTSYTLSEFIDSFGSEVTQGLNALQRDNVRLYDALVNGSGTDLSAIEEALYEESPPDEDDNTEDWSVARWLKEIWSNISQFFSSFWSPAEQALREANEDTIQAVVDNDLVQTSSDVDTVAGIRDDFTSFGDSGATPEYIVSILTDDQGDYYEWFSNTTAQNLSAPSFRKSEPEVFVDEYSAHISDFLGRLIKP